MLSQSRAGGSYPTIESTYQDHTLAVTRARAGDHDAALKILQRLLKHYPDEYPLQRDYVMVTAWSGDCKGALRRFQKIRQRKKHKGYFLALMGECMVKQGRYRDAIALLTRSKRKYPDNREIQYHLLQARIGLASDQPSGIVTESFARLNESNLDYPEWFLGNETSFRVNDKTRFYVNYLISRSSNSDLTNGEQDRIGIGVRYRPNPHWLLQQGISRDVNESGQDGSYSRVKYMPSDTWHFEISHDTFATDIDVRARAVDIEADHSAIKITYDIDEAWYWHISLNRLRYSDSNTRRYFYGEYGVLLKQGTERNHRLVAEYYQSSNTLDNVVYFNPERDQSVNIAYELEFLYPESRFKEHKDRLRVSAGDYKQKGFGSHGIWAIAYRQEFKFSESMTFTYELGHEGNVYDGNREGETKFEARLKVKL